MENTVTQQEIFLNLSLDYCKTWTEREAVREIVANARDSNNDDFDVTIQNKVLIVRNGAAFDVFGEKISLEPKHWMLGVSEKHTESPIGRFGEGLKVASAVLLRLGYTDIHIRSGWYSYYPYVGDNPYDESYKERVIWVHSRRENIFYEGTQVRIPNWYLNDFEELFLFPNDERILFSSSTRDLLRCEKDEEPKLYVSGVFICNLSQLGAGRFTYSYNLDGEKIELSRDRHLPSSFRVLADIGRLWAEVDNMDLKIALWQSIKNHAAEIRMDWDQVRYYLTEDTKHEWRDVINITYGGEVIIQTNVIFSKFILDEGNYVPVVFPEQIELQRFLETIGIISDLDVQLDEELEDLIIPDSQELNRSQSTNLRMIQHRIDKLAQYLNFLPFEIVVLDTGLTEDGELILSQLDRKRRRSYFHSSVLSDRVKSFSEMYLHMVCHWYDYDLDNILYSQRFYDAMMLVTATASAKMF